MERDDILYALKLLVIAEIAAVFGSTILLLLVFLIDNQWALIIYPSLMIGAFIVWLGISLIHFIADYWLD